MIERWHIVGAGAMGRLMACKLKRIGLDPVLLARETASATLTLRLRGEEGETRFEFPVLATDAVPPASVRGLLVTTKANRAADAVRSLRGALRGTAPVVLLHNGMGVQEQLWGELPLLNLHAGTTTEGAWLDGDVLVHAGRGETVIGRSRRAAPDWFAPFADSDERFRWDPDIDAALWRKLLINCAINPLTALHQVQNGALLDNPALRAEVELLCEELAAVSAARGNDRGASCALDWALAVIQATARNRSSMLRDVEAGRETEIDYINGYLVSEARRLGVACPRNERLLAQVRSLDSSRSSH